MGRVGVKGAHVTQKLLAGVLQALGVLAIAAGVGVVTLWGGIVALGIGMVVFGIALERDS